MIIYRDQFMIWFWKLFSVAFTVASTYAVYKIWKHTSKVKTTLEVSDA